MQRIYTQEEISILEKQINLLKLQEKVKDNQYRVALAVQDREHWKELMQKAKQQSLEDGVLRITNNLISEKIREYDFQIHRISNELGQCLDQIDELTDEGVHVDPTRNMGDLTAQLEQYKKERMALAHSKKNMNHDMLDQKHNGSRGDTSIMRLTTSGEALDLVQCEIKHIELTPIPQVEDKLIELKKKIRDQFIEFDDANPKDQSVNVRCALREMKHYLLLFEKQRVDNLKQYYFLSGWLYDKHLVFQSISSEENEFYQLMQRLTQMLQTNEAIARQFYNAYQRKHTSLSNISRKQLLFFESRYLTDLLSQFHLKLCKLPQASKEMIACREKGFALAGYIRNQSMSSTSDRHYLIHIVKKHIKLLEPAQTQKAYDKRYHDCERLARLDTEGQGSWSLKLGGLALGFLGALIVAGGIAIMIASCGVATPLAAIGIGTGVSFFLPGLGVTAAGTSFSYCVGKRVYRQGTEKGYTKHMHEFSKATRAASFFKPKNLRVPEVKAYPEAKPALLSPGSRG